MATPVFNMVAIERLREKLYNRVFAGILNSPVDGPGLDRLAKQLQRTLPKGASYDAIFESIRSIAGKTLTPTLAAEWSWRLAGNLRRIRAGELAAPWASQYEDEWIPLQILRGTPMRNDRNKTGYEFTFRVLAGTSCPLLIRAFWQSRASKYVAMRIGFSKPWGGFPYQHPRQLVGLRLLGKVIAASSRGQPDFHEVACPPSFVDWNRDNILKLRLRAHGLTCPNNFVHACHNCAVGYEACSAGTHLRSYEVGFCNKCGKSDAVFDPEEQSLNCMDCNRTIRMAKRD